jgi:hypothetical protein
MRSSACAWQLTACNWWATFIALLCSSISSGWLGHGPPGLNGTRAQIQTENSTKGRGARQAQLWREPAVSRLLRAQSLRQFEVDVRGRQVAGAPLFTHPSFAILYCPEPQSMVASKRRRTAPLRWRSTRRMPFRGQDDPGFESSLDDSL